jgi:hypothetical protein
VRNSSTKQLGPTTREGRQIVYDRDMFITICRRHLQGEDLRAICAKPPMPVEPVFLGWVQDHPEARAIYKCACNFKSDRMLAKDLNIPSAIGPSSEWAEEVYTNLEQGCAVDYVDRKWMPPDWEESVYPLIGFPPVLSTESMQAYDDLRDEFTQMLKPRDVMELIWTKDAVDATWEAGREARERNAVPERQYRLRLINNAQLRRQPPPVVAAPATANDHSLGLRAGFKYYQALDMTQSRKMKRRDNALRQIARWRDGLGGTAKVLSNKFVSEQALAKRYSVAHLLVDAETNALDSAAEAAQTAPSVSSAESPVAPEGEIAQSVSSAHPANANAAQSVPAADPASASESALLLACTGEPTLVSAAEAPSPLAPAGNVAQAAPAASGATGQGAPPLAPAKEIAQTTAAGAFAGEPADAAHPCAPEGEVEVEMYGVTASINWVAWLTGVQRYPWSWLMKAGEKAFDRPFMSKRGLARHLVLDCKIIPPDQVCPALARYLQEREFPSLSGAARAEEHK